MQWDWELIREECTGCGICADVCPYDAIHMTRATAYPEARPGRCVGCLLCVEQCPFHAIEVAASSSAAGPPAAAKESV